VKISALPQFRRVKLLGRRKRRKTIDNQARRLPAAAINHSAGNPGLVKRMTRIIPAVKSNNRIGTIRIIG
jgi:hypothetical protein